MSDEKGRIEKLETQIADIHEGMTDMRATLDKISTALLGDPEMHIDGLVHKQKAFRLSLERYEKRIAELEDFKSRLKYKIAGFSAGGAGSAWVILEKLFGQ